MIFRCLDAQIEEGIDIATTIPLTGDPEKHPAKSTFEKLVASDIVSNAQESNPDGSSERRLYSFSILLRTYMSRRMTKESDSLNAFRGILTAFKRLLFPEGFVHGLPPRGHTSSLAWMHSRDVTPRRRAGFPSWSWTGWEGEVVYPEKLLDTADGHTLPTLDIDL